MFLIGPYLYGGPYKTEALHWKCLYLYHLNMFNLVWILFPVWSVFKYFYFLYLEYGINCIGLNRSYLCGGSYKTEISNLKCLYLYTSGQV